MYKKKKVAKKINPSDILLYSQISTLLSQCQRKLLLQQIGEYDESLPGLRFQNCCRGYVVSLDHVRSLKVSNFLMHDGSSVPISRPRYKAMKTAYANYLFSKTRNMID